MIVEYRDCIKTMKETSYDSASKEYVTECDKKVIDFDKFTEVFFKNFTQCPKVPESVDAVCKINGEWYLIEFKNGKYKKRDIVNKFAHSLLILMRNENINTLEAAQSINFILVIGDPKLTIRQNVYERADKPNISRDFESFKGSYFKSIYTFRKTKFENFITGKNIEFESLHH